MTFRALQKLCMLTKREHNRPCAGKGVNKKYFERIPAINDLLQYINDDQYTLVVDHTTPEFEDLKLQVSRKHDQITSYMRAVESKIHFVSQHFGYIRNANQNEKSTQYLFKESLFKEILREKQMLQTPYITLNNKYKQIVYACTISDVEIKMLKVFFTKYIREANKFLRIIISMYDELVFELSPKLILPRT